jgi:hypothetical protein
MTVTMTKQGVRDLNKMAVVLVEPATGLVHRRHRLFEATTGCDLDTNEHQMYQPLEPQTITCLECVSRAGSKDKW